jgi:predicted ATPase/serine/threonine protein kinase
MTIPPEQWSSVKDIFNAAVALAGPARAAYLETACAGDPSLRQHVDSLLASHDQAESFLETPAADVLQVPADELSGRVIGTYRVESRIGRGGMGEVYRAHDTRLDRPVALKLLSPGFAGDAERMRRFHAEVRAVSSLNHPHILVVHDLGDVDGRPFMVSELVEGQTLRQRLAAGPLTMRETLEIATQIASALSAAHGRAIVHRDIKPENIMVRPDGYVKVLDFGLAKLAPAGLPGEGATGTFTNPGMVMGTPQYMSPEQARGHDVDFRSDQFSFGVLVYELATGRSPFARASAVETAASVITDQPEPILRLRPETPAPLVWAIERCLAKNRDDRYASTTELDRDLASVHQRIGEVRPTTVEGPPSNLPSAGTPLVGREADLAAIGAMLRQDEVRWVTLTGPGGVGKTRLAIQVAASLTSEFAGATYFVPLASITDPSLVPSAIAGTLEVRAVGGEGALAALKHYFASAPPTLLVIDNVEHVADAAATIAELLDVTRAVKVLATSRAGLHVAEEHEYQVATLRLPQADRVRDVADLAAAPAVALFVERARAARADFVLSIENAKAVAAICTSLDGLPLAIELAAARVKVLPPNALLAHLEGRRLSLTGTARNLPARQQTLRQTIDWGYELLAPAEQRLFRRLAVFAGGWTLEAAEAVCDAREDLGLDVFDGISSLVDKSLVRPADASSTEARFAMLATIRDYAIERLTAAGELDSCRQAHAAYCLIIAEEGNTSDAAEHIRWLELCEREHANLLAAIEFLIVSQQQEWALRLCSALLPFWQGRAHFAEATNRLTRALRLADGAPPTEARTRATFALGTLLATMGEMEKAIQIHTEVLSAFRELGDQRGTAVALNAIGTCYYLWQRADEAEAPYAEALSIFRGLGDEQAVARTLSNVAGMALERGDVNRAASLLKEVRETSARHRDTSGEGWALNFEAQVELRRGDRAAADRLFLEALTRFQSIRDTWGTGDSLLALGHLACDMGAGDQARQRFAEAHAVFTEVGDIRGLVRVIEAFARLAAEDRDAVRALTLAGAAAALRQRLGTPLPPAPRQVLDQALEHVRHGTNVGSAWMDGWAMSTEDAVQYAVAPRSSG